MSRKPHQRKSSIPKDTRQQQINEFIRRGFIRSESEIPRDAILANVDRQRSISWSPPRRLYYIDREFHCQTCRKKQTWTARQQFWWYEIAQGDLESVAVRCRDCRKAIRSTAIFNEAQRRKAQERRAIKRASELTSELGRQPNGFEVLEWPVSDLVLPQKILNLLKENGITKLETLVGCSSERLQKFGISSSDVPFVSQQLKELGLALVGAPVTRPSTT